MQLWHCISPPACSNSMIAYIYTNYIIRCNYNNYRGIGNNWKKLQISAKIILNDMKIIRQTNTRKENVLRWTQPYYSKQSRKTL